MSFPILVALHTGSKTGYAIAPLERAFFQMAQHLVEDDTKIHFAYRNLERGRPDTLPENFHNIVSLDIRDRSRVELGRVESYVRSHGIRTVFAFDAPVALPSYGPMRKAGVQRIISYQGAPMSSIFPRWKLALKKLEVRLQRHRPDHYIFESEAMRATAVEGRGISRDDTSVVYLGADTNRFAPRARGYAHAQFGIPGSRLLVVFSGHMEPRKGVHVLIESFVELVDRRGRENVHLLVLGNQPGQERAFENLYVGSKAEGHITFGGYRNDVADIFGSADLGAIASTGWDSFTMSSVEMALSGLPLLVSNLQGLAETVDDGVTGYTFPPGDARRLADLIELFTDNPNLRCKMGRAARRRAVERHSVETQVAELAKLVRAVCAD
ncbi:MAG TPA: glycosyltransferase family 4 protein [Longimicrobiaceae bacterium]